MRDVDFYLDNMPIAFCAIEVLTDEEGKPRDYRFTYSNKAHARLEGCPHGQLLGRRYLEIHDKISPRFLSGCYEAAYQGKEQVLNDYNAERDRHFLIYIYPLEAGSCACMMQDVTESRRLELDLLHENEKRKFLLESATEIIFEYDRTKDVLTFWDSGNVSEENKTIARCPESLVERGVIREGDEKLIDGMFRDLSAGKRVAEFNIQACLDGSGIYSWYTVRCSVYSEKYTGHLRVIGCLRNVDRMIREQRALQREAMYDPLVDLYNVKAGKELVSEELDKTEDNEVNMMFLMDLDDFKYVNDTYGHQKGDEFLKRFAAALKNTFRKSDVVYRMGGDEFIGFTSNVSKPEQAVERIMGRLYRELEEARQEGFDLRCSVGVFMTSRRHSYSHFYNMADQALYAAKRAGKHQYQIIRDM